MNPTIRSAEATVRSLLERLKGHHPSLKCRKAGTELAKIGRALRKRPVLDARSDDEILGYDEHGLPT